MHDFIGVDGVIGRERLNELSKRSDARALAQLASHLGALAASTIGLAVTWGTAWTIPFFLLQGLLINFLYAPEHECDHSTAFETRWLNVWVAKLCGFFIFLPSDYHRFSHFTHHRHTQDWENDTELTPRRVFTSPAQYIWALLGVERLFQFVRVMVLHAMGQAEDPYLTEPQRRILVREARWYLTAYLCVAASAIAMKSWWPLIYWIGPFLVMRWTYWLQGLGEHTGLTHEANTLLNTRTLETNAFMRWLNWNMTYHTVHHTFPCVPFYRLPELHREVVRRLGRELPGESYFALHVRHLRLLAASATELDICQVEADDDRRRSADLEAG